jgi:hypothetical protein
MYWGNVNMYWELITMSWELVTMYWHSPTVSIKPLNMSRYTVTIHLDIHLVCIWSITIH